MSVIEIILPILTSALSSGIVITLLRKHFEEKIRAKFQKEIDQNSSKLEILKQTILRYSDKQFEFYNKLWASLYDLKVCADDLWEKATRERLRKYSQQLKGTKNEIEKSALFIEDAHYEELSKLIKFFSEYEIGKRKLIEIRIQDVSDHEIQELIQNNREKKVEYDELIDKIKMDLKKQIKG